MKKLLIVSVLLCFFGMAVQSCKTKDVNRYSKEKYIKENYKELKEMLPEAQVTLLNDTIRVMFPNNLLFPTGEFAIHDKVRPLMGSLASCINKYNKTNILICGHTDNVGVASYNERLSHKRAESARDVLLANDVVPARMTTWGFGDRQPIASNDNETDRELNRRVEFIILIDKDAIFKK